MKKLKLRVKRLVEQVKRLKSKFNFYKGAVAPIVKAVSDTISKGKPDKEVMEFRKKRCSECPLFNGTHCNSNKMATHGGYMIDTKDVEDSNSYVKIYDKNNVLRVAVSGSCRYVRGCGCRVAGDGAKWSFNFSPEDLAKRDGTAPCPLNRWSEVEFQKYIKDKN